MPVFSYTKRLEKEKDRVYVSKTAGDGICDAYLYHTNGLWRKD